MKKITEKILNEFKGLKKYLKNSYLKTYFTLLISMFMVEVIFKLIEDNSLFAFATVRIFIGLNIVSAILAYLLEFTSKIWKKILTSIIVFGTGFYACLQCGFLNFIGVYISFQTSSQLGAVKDYIADFFRSFKYEYLCTFIPFVLLIIFYIFFDKKFKTYKVLHMRRLLATGIIVVGGSLLYLASITLGCFQNELQTISNYDLFRSASNPSLSVDNFGSLGFLITDIKALIWPVEITETYVEEKKEQKVDDEHKRDIDDTAWNMVSEEETNSTYQKLNNYFKNRTVTAKNEYTGLFEGKNLIIIMMESTNDIFINEKYFPNFYKMVKEGWYWENNYSPRNSCATMNNEFSGMTGLYTISNTCTASKYRGNKYYESIFNLFNRTDNYVTFSAHDYTAAYYPRKSIHSNMGSNDYYSVERLGIRYSSAYINWANDDDFLKKVLSIIDNKTSKGEHFMTWLTTVSAHQPYTVSSIQGDKYLGMTKGTGYPSDIRRYMSKLKIQDQGLGILLEGLNKRGILDDTVIVLYGDHYPYGISKSHINKVLDYNTSNSMNAERVPFVIYNSTIEPKTFSDYTSYINIVPTLANLFNLDYDPRLYLGEDLLSDDYESITIFADGSWKNEVAYYNAKRNSVSYFTDKKYTAEELSSINNSVSTKLSISNSAIKSNYFNHLGNALSSKQAVVDELNKTTCKNSEKTTYTTNKTKK